VVEIEGLWRRRRLSAKEERGVWEACEVHGEGASWLSWGVVEVFGRGEGDERSERGGGYSCLLQF